MLRYIDEKFHDPKIVFTNGVAEIDVITLHLAAAKVDDVISDDILLPKYADISIPAVFNDLSEVAVLSTDPVRVTATIDTQKVKWDKDKVSKSVFTGYDQVEHYGVQFSKISMINTASVGQVGMVPIKLDDDRKLTMWFAEIPLDSLENMGLYALYQTARDITDSRSKGAVETYDSVTVPAQQIKYQRSMSEITEPNKQALKGGDILQRAYVGLDETGVRVKVVTEFRAGAFRNPNPQPPKIKVFGEKHPVVFWLTEADFAANTVPFAVFATTSAAWLDPSQSVSFEDNAFTQ